MIQQAPTNIRRVPRAEVANAARRVYLAENMDGEYVLSNVLSGVALAPNGDGDYVLVADTDPAARHLVQFGPNGDVAL